MHQHQQHQQSSSSSSSSSSSNNISGQTPHGQELKVAQIFTRVLAHAYAIVYLLLLLGAAVVVRVCTSTEHHPSHH
jgi:hypothetical protein